MAVGLTVMVKLCGAPAHPAADGVTVMVATRGVVPVLMAVKEAMSPLPDAASPIAGLEFVQLYVVPATPPLKLMA